MPWIYGKSGSLLSPVLLMLQEMPSSVWPISLSVLVCPSQAWNVLALDGSNWQKIDLFNFQTDIEVSFMFETRMCERLLGSVMQPKAQCCDVDWDSSADLQSCCPLTSLFLSLFAPASLRAGWWKTFRSVVEVSWGSLASGAAWALEMLLWSEIPIVSLEHTD